MFSNLAQSKTRSGLLCQNLACSQARSLLQEISTHNLHEAFFERDERIYSSDNLQKPEYFLRFHFSTVKSDSGRLCQNLVCVRAGKVNRWDSQELGRGLDLAFGRGFMVVLHKDSHDVER